MTALTTPQGEQPTPRTDEHMRLRPGAGFTEVKLTKQLERELTARAEAAEKRLEFICRQAWETRQDSDNDPEYLYHLGLVAEINSGNYEGVDAACLAESSRKNLK